MSKEMTLEIPEDLRDVYVRLLSERASENGQLAVDLIERIARLEQDLSAAKAETDRLSKHMDRVASIEEKSHLQTIDERDAAEETLSQAYYLIRGQSPEWSNLFGHTEALEEIDDAQRCLRSEIKSLEATIARLTTQVDAHVQLLTRFRDKLKIILPRVDGFVVLQAVRSGNPNIYDGPNIEQEMKEADELLAARLAAAQGGK